MKSCYSYFVRLIKNYSEPRGSYRSSSALPEASITEHQLVQELLSSFVATVPQQTNR